MKTRGYISRTDYGFTLVEMLAVLVIMSAVSVITMSGLSSADAYAQLDRAAARLKQLDRLARIESPRRGAIELVIETDSEQIIVRELRTNTVMKSEHLPHGITVQLRNSKRELIDTVEINRSGRSYDYTVHIELGGQTRAYSVAGLTGLIIEERLQRE